VRVSRATHEKINERNRNLVGGHTLYLAFLESRYNTTFRTDVNHFRMRITKVEPKEKIIYATNASDTLCDFEG
jgi:hypothetical protein